MKVFLKRLMVLLTAISVLIVGNASIAFANDSFHAEKFSLNLNEFDKSQPYVETIHFEKDGEPGWIKLTYTPALTRDAATEGTWKSEAFWVVAGMSYSFDLSKSGSEWKISNARDLSVNCVGGTVQDQSLSINRSVSSASKPAEVTGKMTCNVIGDLGSVTFMLKTKVQNGEVTTEIN